MDIMRIRHVMDNIRLGHMMGINRLWHVMDIIRLWRYIEYIDVMGTLLHSDKIILRTIRLLDTYTFYAFVQIMRTLFLLWGGIV